MEEFISTFFIFNRNIFNWKFYTDPNVFRLFFHLVGKANHTHKYWRGINVYRGELITSLEHLSKELDLSVNQIRLAIKKLDENGSIKYKPTNKYTRIIIPNYNAYQTNDILEINNIKKKSQSNNTQITITNNKNNTNNENEDITIKRDFFQKNMIIINKHANRVMCDKNAIDNYKARYGLSKNEIKNAVEDFNYVLLCDETGKISINKYFRMLDGFLESRYHFYNKMNNYIRYDIEKYKKSDKQSGDEFDF